MSSRGLACRRVHAWALNAQDGMGGELPICASLSHEGIRGLDLVAGGPKLLLAEFELLLSEFDGFAGFDREISGLLNHPRRVIGKRNSPRGDHDGRDQVCPIERSRDTDHNGSDTHEHEWIVRADQSSPADSAF